MHRDESAPRTKLSFNLKRRLGKRFIHPSSLLLCSCLSRSIRKEANGVHRKVRGVERERELSSHEGEVDDDTILISHFRQLHRHSSHCSISSHVWIVVDAAHQHVVKTNFAFDEVPCKAHLFPGESSE